MYSLNMQVYTMIFIDVVFLVLRRHWLFKDIRWPQHF